VDPLDTNLQCTGVPADFLVRELCDWTVIIPPGATAKLRVPGKLIEINGNLSGLINGVSRQDVFQGKAERFVLPSGNYQLAIKLM